MYELPYLYLRQGSDLCHNYTHNAYPLACLSEGESSPA